MADSLDSVPQTGVIAYRHRARRLEVLLITSRSQGRWVIPKGGVETHLGPRKSAKEEAYEEAGIRGSLDPVLIGYYEHGTSSPTTRVGVFLMEVDKELSTWPEEDERDRKWMPIQEAIEAVEEEGLKRLLHIVAELLH